MPLTTVQILAIILAVSLGTQITRWLPFLLFPESKQPPKVVLYLGKVLPPAMMGLLTAATARRSCWPPPLWWDFICGRRTCCCPLRAVPRCIWFFFRSCSPDA